MARNRLTWQNVAAPDYSTAVQGQALAHKMFQDAIGGLSSSIGSYAQQQGDIREQQIGEEQSAAEAALLRSLASASGNTEAQAGILRSLGGNSQVSNDFLKDLLTTTRNSMLSGDTTSTNLEQTRLLNERTNRDAALMDQFRPISGSAGAYVASGGSNPLAVMTPEQRAKFNELPATEQTRLTDAWSREGTQARDRSDYSVNQAAEQLALSAQASGIDGADQSAHIYQNSPNALVAARALEYLSRAPSLTDPRGQTNVGTGRTAVGGGVSQQGSAGAYPTEGNAGRESQITASGINSRSSQERDVLPIDGYLAAERDGRSDTELADSLIAEDGPFPGGSRRDALNAIQKLKADYPGITSNQAAYALANNTRADRHPLLRGLMDYTPLGLIDRGYNSTVGDGLNLRGGEARVDSTGIAAGLGMISSPAYRQQQEAELERQDQQTELARLEKVRNDALQRLEQARELERVTGGNSRSSNEEENLQRLDEEIQAIASQVRNDPRFGRLIRDPDNPSNTITEGELRDRRIREATARAAAEREAELQSQQSQSIEPREILQSLMQNYARYRMNLRNRE